MKNNTIIALLLTFFMLLLVLSAAVVFLYQDRRLLTSDVSGLQLGATAVAANAQREVSNIAAQNLRVAATATASHNDLVQAEATRDALSARVATLEAVEIPTAAPTATPAQPFVTITSPENGVFLSADEPIDVVAFAAHPSGIETVELLVDDEPQELLPSDGPYRVLTLEEPLTLDPGNHTITALITGADNQSSSAAVSFTVNAPAGGDGDGENGNDS